MKPFNVIVDRADIPVLLDAIEAYFSDFDSLERCPDPGCDTCRWKIESLTRVRDALMKASPLAP